MPFLLLSLGNSQSLLSARRPVSQPAVQCSLLLSVGWCSLGGFSALPLLSRGGVQCWQWYRVSYEQLSAPNELSSREMNLLPRAMSNFLVSPSSYSFRAACGLVLFLISNKKKENSSFGVLRETTVPSHTRTLYLARSFLNVMKPKHTENDSREKLGKLWHHSEPEENATPHGTNTPRN